jgi:hypothetical protein
MRRWGLAFVMTAVLVSGCAPDPPILSPDATIEIVRRPGFVAELSVPRWDAHCIDPPDITIRLDGKESSFVSCDDPDQKNDLLHVVLDHVYNELSRVVAAD